MEGITAETPFDSQTCFLACFPPRCFSRLFGCAGCVPPQNMIEFPFFQEGRVYDADGMHSLHTSQQGVSPQDRANFGAQRFYSVGWDDNISRRLSCFLFSSVCATSLTCNALFCVRGCSSAKGAHRQMETVVHHLVAKCEVDVHHSTLSCMPDLIRWGRVLYEGAVVVLSILI